MLDRMGTCLESLGLVEGLDFEQGTTPHLHYVSIVMFDELNVIAFKLAFDVMVGVGELDPFHNPYWNS